MAKPVLIDGPSLAYRAVMATAMEDLRVGSVPTGGIYGTIRSLVTILEAVRDPSFITVAFDHGVPKYRLKLCPAYKAPRKERRQQWTEEETERVFGQIAVIKKILKTLGCRVVSFSNREADDVVAALATHYTSVGEAPVIVSGDKDLFQLLNLPGASLWYLGTGGLIGAADIAEKYNVPVQAWCLYKALLGDTSDNVPGVHGCGAKRAAVLIAETSTYYAQGNRGRFFNAALPAAQLSAMVEMLQDRKRKAYEQAVVDAHKTIEKMLRVVDLTQAPLPVDACKRVAYADPEPERKAFLRYCRKLHFQSMMADMNRYYGLFERAHARRAKQLAHTFGDNS